MLILAQTEREDGENALLFSSLLLKGRGYLLDLQRAQPFGQASCLLWFKSKPDLLIENGSQMLTLSFISVLWIFTFVRQIIHTNLLLEAVFDPLIRFIDYRFKRCPPILYFMFYYFLYLILNTTKWFKQTFPDWAHGNNKSCHLIKVSWCNRMSTII